MPRLVSPTGIGMIVVRIMRFITTITFIYAVLVPNVQRMHQLTVPTVRFVSHARRGLKME